MCDSLFLATFNLSKISVDTIIFWGAQRQKLSLLVQQSATVSKALCFDEGESTSHKDWSELGNTSWPEFEGGFRIGFQQLDIITCRFATNECTISIDME